MNQYSGIYLALYKGYSGSVWERLQDWVIRKMTKGQYSHCEIAIAKQQLQGHYHYHDYFECFSSSPRDGGVRRKIIDVKDASKWDLIPVTDVTEAQILRYFEQTNGKKYDMWGALGLILGFKQQRERLFCSEWCFNALRESDEGWRFSPNHLAVIVKPLKTAIN